MARKVLIVNWSWYPSGGDWTYIENLSLVYKQMGYEIISFSVNNAKNVERFSNNYFIDVPDYKTLNRNKSLKNGLLAIKNSIKSNNALRNLQKLLDEHTIDIAHLHNIHHYQTPAIIWKLKQHHIRVLWTLHDYKIICPENSFVSNGRLCQKCLGGHFYNCAMNKCKKGSLAASILATMEAYYYHNSKIYDKVDAYLCPSEFIYEKFVEFGFDRSRLFVTNLCYDISAINNYILEKADHQTAPIAAAVKEYILFLGRVEHLKGVTTLINAVRNTGINLMIAGTGTALGEMTQYVQENAISNVHFLGFQEKHDIYKLIHQAKYVVCPSEWFENFPYAIIESLLFSKPVVGAKIGGIPELVIHGKTGLLFEPKNIEDLREKLMTLWNNPQLVNELGRNGNRHVTNLVNYNSHSDTLKEIISKIQNEN